MDGGRDILATPYKDKCKRRYCHPHPPHMFYLKPVFAHFLKASVGAFPGSSSPSCESPVTPGSVRLIPCLWGCHHLGHTSLATLLRSQSHLPSIPLPDANWLLLPWEVPLPSMVEAWWPPFGLVPPDLCGSELEWKSKHGIRILTWVSISSVLLVPSFIVTSHCAFVSIFG